MQVRKLTQTELENFPFDNYVDVAITVNDVKYYGESGVSNDDAQFVNNEDGEHIAIEDYDPADPQDPDIEHDVDAECDFCDKRAIDLKIIDGDTYNVCEDHR